MKPHLKLHTSGEVTVLQTGTKFVSEKKARSSVLKRYGSLAAFARIYRLEYHHVLNAFAGPQYARSAGGVAHVRQMLGMRSLPTMANARLVEAQRTRRVNAPRSKRRARA